MLVLEIARKLINLLPASEKQSWIVDGGCHVGIFSGWAIKLFPSSNVLSFEPDPDSWANAQKNLGAHKQIEIVKAALGAEKGQADFFRGQYSVTNSLLPRPASELRPYFPEQDILKGGTLVDVVTIDEECKKRGIEELDVLKLDLQGGELAALAGAKAKLESELIKVIIVEVVFIKKYQDQPLFWEIWQKLEMYGYTLYSLEDVKIGLYHAEPMSLRHRQWNQCDAIFISKPIRKALDK
jgi:FkbM family methyltransferase